MTPFPTRHQLAGLSRRRLAALGLAAVTVVAGMSGVPTGLPAADAATCTPKAPTLVPVLRMNVGGPRTTTGWKTTWQADAYYTGGTATTIYSATDIAGTFADPLYRSERWGRFSYEIPVPSAGEYVTRLHFAEIYFGADGRSGGAGSRVFSINLEGGPAELADFDISAAVGPMRAVVKTHTTTVTDGKLSISSHSSANHPKLSALEVLRKDPGTTCPPIGTSPFGPGTGRPFVSTSAWNVPIPADPVLDANSRSMVAVIARDDRAYANLYAYGDPVFDADASSPSYTVECTMDWGPCDLEAQPIRIPADARPTPGSDGRMIVIDWPSRKVCDFWQARRTATGWATSWGTCASVDGDGRGPTGGATGAGVNALAGVVRTYEMRQGRIDHALSFATDNSCQRVFRYPATKTDGSSARADCIPEGARIQLDPTINVDAIPGITPGEKAVAKALQIYGAYNRDNAGAPMAFSFENPIAEADPYPAAGFAWDYYDMPHIPWDRIRVLRQWDGR